MIQFTVFSHCQGSYFGPTTDACRRLPNTNPPYICRTLSAYQIIFATQNKADVYIRASFTSRAGHQSERKLESALLKVDHTPLRVLFQQQ